YRALRRGRLQRRRDRRLEGPGQDAALRGGGPGLGAGKGRDIMTATSWRKRWPDAAGRFEAFGGRFVPETLMPALAELEACFREALADPAFRAELENCLQLY